MAGVDVDGPVIDEGLETAAGRAGPVINGDDTTGRDVGVGGGRRAAAEAGVGHGRDLRRAVVAAGVGGVAADDDARAVFVVLFGQDVWFDPGHIKQLGDGLRSNHRLGSANFAGLWICL